MIFESAGERPWLIVCALRQASVVETMRNDGSGFANGLGLDLMTTRNEIDAPLEPLHLMLSVNVARSIAMSLISGIAQLKEES